jgi:N-carbamoylputrescine amidase
MNRAITIALTETINAYPDMPERTEDLGRLAGKLDDVRRANVLHNSKLIEAAANRGAKIVGLGELFTAPYFAITKHPVWLDLAEDAENGETVRALSDLAKRTGTVIIAPIYEKERSGERRFNTAVVIDDAGRVIGRYRKTHIPDGRNEQGEFNEPFYFGPSNGVPAYFPVFETRMARIGVSICYDRHFEGVVRSLAQNGAEIVFSPAVTFGKKSERMWELEFEVDAARHNVFVAGSNRSGVERPWNQPFFGRSYVVGPNGRPENDRTTEGLVLATIDLDELRTKDPSGWNLVRDRRPAIYTP